MVSWRVKRFTRHESVVNPAPHPLRELFANEPSLKVTFPRLQKLWELKKGENHGLTYVSKLVFDPKLPEPLTQGQRLSLDLIRKTYVDYRYFGSTHQGALNFVKPLIEGSAFLPGDQLTELQKQAIYRAKPMTDEQIHALFKGERPPGDPLEVFTRNLGDYFVRGKEALTSSGPYKEKYVPFEGLTELQDGGYVKLSPIPKKHGLRTFLDYVDHLKVVELTPKAILLMKKLDVALAKHKQQF